jgi:hypothetical protein
MDARGFVSKVLFIHTGLQPGGKQLGVVENRFNGFRGNARKPLKRFSATAYVCHRAKAPV